MEENKLKLINMADVQVEEVAWLLYPLIPFGKITILQGDPGEGKTTVMLHIIACLTKGESLSFVDEKSGTQTTIPVGTKGLQNLPEVEESGSTFEGWFYTKNGKEVKFTSETSVTKDMTVKAKWS